MSQKVLLVEGVNDQHVVWALCEAHKLPECFAVEEKGGKESLLESLYGYFQDPLAYPTVGILLDADERIESTWDAVTGRLQSAGYSVPSHLDAGGLVLDHPTGDGPRIGVWLMPDNSLTGKLEDFVRMLIPAGDELAAEADSALKVIEDKDVQRYADKDRPKAFIHTWLAWQDEPGRPMGAAITRRYLAPTSTQAERFVTWLRQLFLEE